MIYLTAQLVKPSRFSGEGVNAFRRRYPGPLPQEANPLSSIEKILQNPGELIGSSIEIPPGGNAVHAFLDLVIPDDADKEKSRRWLKGARSVIENATSNDIAVPLEGGKALFRFYALPSIDFVATFERLMSAALSTFETTSPEPLRVIVDRGADVSIFRLDDASIARLRVLHGEEWSVPRIHVRDDVSADFEAYHGSLFAHLAEVLTGLARYYVKGLGGIVFIAPNGNELAKWPPSC